MSRNRECDKRWATKNPEKVKEIHKRYYEKNLEKLKEKAKRYYEQNPEKYKAQGKRWREQNPERYREQILKRRYGLTLETFKKMLEDQENKCAICQSIKELNVDHCHKTGKVRGLLCRSCNRNLRGIESPEFLENALRYLKR